MKTERSAYALLPRFGTVINSELLADFDGPRPSLSPDCFAYLETPPLNEEITRNLANSSQLILEVTQGCNFACKYCVYSGKYARTRVHRQKSMDLETAQSSVDHFLRMVTASRRTKNRRSLFFGFYGGEPLLELPLVRRVTDYILRKKGENAGLRVFDFVFRMTTNGALLDREAVDFLVAHRFRLDISLDGPESEHDRFRVFRNQEGTWRRVMANIEDMRRRHPAFAAENVRYLCTIHPEHDTRRIDSFFKGGEQFASDRVHFNIVDLAGLKENHQFRFDRPVHMSECYQKQTWADLKERLRMRIPGEQTRFTGTCFPGGERIFVTSNGDFKICEKMDDDFPCIGNARSGVDHDIVREIVCQYNREILRNQCWNCDWWFLCSICFHNCMQQGKIRFDCGRQIESNRRMLQLYLESIEGKREDANDPAKTVSEFLERLA